jgi:HPt (histidine-containing phosphotransfer) domain-containing protein
MVHLFVVDMPQRVARMKRQFELENWAALIRTAHQLKGAAGSYGFDALTEPAWRLEIALRDGAAPAVIEQALTALVADCRRVTVRPRPTSTED